MKRIELIIGTIICFIGNWLTVGCISSSSEVDQHEFNKAEDRVKALLKRQFDERVKEELTHPEEVIGWPLEEYDLGQISGVDVDKSGNPVIFHRGTVLWDSESFNETHHYQRIDEGPIEEDTIVVLDAQSGQMLASWGVNYFYMPHGITIDSNNSLWLTDVALHQVFKFSPGSDQPLLTIGHRFMPGSSNDCFCKPTDVAVANSGVFFVADGYCNSRILKFNKDGKFLAKFGEEGWLWREGKGSTLAIPHSLALIEEEDALCIADREHHRILCINAGLQKEEQFGEIISVTSGVYVGRIFGVSYADGHLYGINGAGSSPAMTQGLTIDWKNSQVMDTWTSSRSFISPHDIAVSRDGSTIFISEIGPNRLTKFVVTSSLMDLDSSQAGYNYV